MGPRESKVSNCKPSSISGSVTASCSNDYEPVPADEGRSDDDEVAIAHRFEVFETQTEPLLAFYAGRGILLEINGEQPVEDVFGDITTAVDSRHIPG